MRCEKVALTFLDTFRSNLTEVFRAHPIALGAIGLAIGAGIAAALPATEVEAAYLGETSDAVKAKATECASEQTEHVTKLAGAVIDAVSEEARRQGLTMEEAKSAAGDISAKIARVAEAASKGVPERLRPNLPKATLARPSQRVAPVARGRPSCVEVNVMLATYESEVGIVEHVAKRRGHESVISRPASAAFGRQRTDSTRCPMIRKVNSTQKAHR
jgi:hypothetical protein